MFQSTTRKC